MTAVGHASIAVAASLKGIGEQIRKEVQEPLDKAGKAAGKSLEKNVSSSVTKAAKSVEQARNTEAAAAKKVVGAEKELESARSSAEAAAKAVESAELKLDAARSSGDERVLKAEEQLAKLRDSGKASTEALEAAELKLEAAKSKAAASALDAENRVTAARDKAAGAVEKVQVAEEKLIAARVQATDASKQLIDATRKYDSEQSKANAAAAKADTVFGRLKTAAKDAAGGIKSAGHAIGDFAEKYKVHAAAIVGGLGVAAKGAMDYAAEAEQSYGAVESIFGKHADGIIASSKKAAQEVGLSGREYRELSSSVGAMLKNLGTPMDQVAGKTQGLVTVAADLAATFGGPTSDAVEAVNSLLRGEANPIERYGVSIKKADVNARLAAKGLNKLKGEELKLAESQELLAMLTEQTSAAQGQFGREIDTAANKQQRAKAAFDDAKEAIGTRLLPVMGGLADIAGKVAEAVSEHPGIFLAAAGAIGGLAAAVVGVAGVAGTIGAINGLFATLNLTLGGTQLTLGLLASTVKGFLLAIAPWAAAIAAVGLALWAFFTKTETGRKLWDQLVDAFKAGWQWVKDTFIAGWDKLVEKFELVKAAWGELTSAFSGGDMGFAALGDIFGSEEAGKKVADFAEQVGQKFTDVKNKVREIKPAWSEVTAAFQGKDNGLGALSNILGSEDAARKVTDVIEKAGNGFRELSDAAKWAWENVLKPFGVFLKDQFFAALDDLKKPVDDVKDAFGALKDALGGAVMDVWKTLAESGKEVGKSLKELWEVLEPVLVPALKIVGAIIGGVVIGAIVALVVALRVAAKIFAFLVKILAKLIKAVLPPLIKFVGFLVKGFMKLATVIIKHVVNKIKLLISLFTDFKGTMSRAWDAVKDAWGKAKEFFGKLWDGIKDVFAGVGEWFGEKFSGAKDAAVGAFTGMGDQIGEAWGGVKSAIGSAIESTKSFISDNWQAIVTILLGPFGAVSVLVVEHWDKIKSVFQAGIEWIKNAWSGLWNGIKSVAETVWNGIVAFFQGAWNGLVSIAKAVFDGLKNYIVGTWDKMTGALVQVWTVASDAVQDGWNFLKDKAREIFENLRAAVVNAWEKLASRTVEIWDGIQSKLSAVWDAVVSVVSDAVEKLKQKISDFASHGKQKIDEFLKLVKGIGTKVKDAFKDAGRWLFDAGKNIINGLINGIKSMGSAVANAVDSVMPDWVPGFAGGGFTLVEQNAVGSAPVVRGTLPRHALFQPAHGKRGLVQYAEASTGGEYMLPRRHLLAQGERALGILARAAADAGATVIDNKTGEPVGNGYQGNLGPVTGFAFADGGFTAPEVLDWVKGRTVRGVKPPAGRALEGFPYTWGGGSPSNWGDCSGMVSLVAGLVKGLWAKSPLRRLFSTANQGDVLAKMGFKPGLGDRDDFNVGWYNGGAGGGHTSASVNGVNIEMGGARGNGQIGGRAASPRHSMYKHHVHYPLHASKGDAASKIGEVADVMTGSAGGGSASVSWGKAQDLWNRATAHLGVSSDIKAYSASSTGESVDPLTPGPDGVPVGMGKPAGGTGWGHAFFVSEIARQAKSKRLSERGAMIGVATALVESGNPLKMWANRAVPGSLAFKHDAVGSDHDSVGLFQQRDNGAWGTLAQRMNAFESAGLFYNAMLKKFPKWASMEPGAVAQGVQVSAFPDRYAKQMAAALEMVKSTGLYDSGGVLGHGQLALNLSRKPEAILTNKQWGDFAKMTVALERLIDNGIEVSMDSVAGAGFNLGGDWLGQMEIVKDAERGLAETRAAIASQTSNTAELEAELAEARAEADKARAAGGKLSVAQTRKIADAEEALAKARASGDPEKIAKAQKRLDRAREDSAAALEKSSDKSSKDLAKAMQRVEKAEKALTDAQTAQKDAALQLAAAERTVAAARFQAIGELATNIGNEIAKIAGSVVDFAGVMVKASEMLEATRQEVAKLRMEQVNLRIAVVKSAHGLRLAEQDLMTARWNGIVSVAKAEAELNKARRGHMKMGETSVSALARKIDRFRVGGLKAFDELAVEFVADLGEVKVAEAALAEARAQAALDEQLALIRQNEALFAVQEATMLQQQNAQMLQLQTAFLTEQTKQMFGINTSSAMAFQRAAQGVMNIIQGIVKVIGGIATALAGFAVAGPLGAIPGVIAALGGIKDIATGAAAVHANKGQAREAWNQMDSGAKVTIGLGLAGGAMAAIAGGVGAATGMGPGALVGGVQVGAAIVDATLGSVMGVMDQRMIALQAQQKDRLDQMQREFALDKSILDSSKASAAARAALKQEELKAEVELAKLRKELAKAEADGEAANVLDAMRGAVTAAEKRHKALVDEAAVYRAGLDAADKQLSVSGAANRRSQPVTIVIPEGDSFSAEQVEAMLKQVGDRIDGVEVDVKKMKSDNKPGALDYARARR